MSAQLSGLALVPQGTGYGLLIGLGVAFCGVILIAIKIQKAYLSEDSGTSEMFMVANRSVGTGLTASAVFSSWMWINETVLSAAMCYNYGLAVPLVSWSFCHMGWSVIFRADVYVVVGNGSLLPDRFDGGPGCHGQNSSPICSYFPRNHTDTVRPDWAYRLYRIESHQQRFWMCLDDSDGLTTHLWHLGHELCRGHHTYPSWR
jgi:hypothetical protein